MKSRCEEKEERQELKLGDAQGTPSKYSRILKSLSLGMPRKASPLSSTNIGMFSDSFHSCDMCKSWSVFCVQFSFLFFLFSEFLDYQKYGECSDYYRLSCLRHILFLMHSLLVLMKLLISISGLSHGKVILQQLQCKNKI